MIQEITLTRRIQTPTPPNEWLYHESADGFRTFHERVLLGKDAEPWPECTDIERLAWQTQWDESHKEPAPEPSDVPANVPADPANEGKEAEV